MPYQLLPVEVSVDLFVRIVMRSRQKVFILQNNTLFLGEVKRMVYVVEKISIFTMVLYFIIYLVGHFVIVLSERRLRKEIDDGNKNPDKITAHKTLKFLTKWFAAIYVVFLLSVLYFG